MSYTLKIQNYKCLKDINVPFEQLTVLVGANSVGKSSIIQALLLSRISIEHSKRIFAECITIPLNGPYLLSLGNSLGVLNRDSNANDICFMWYENEASHVSLKFFVNDTDKTDNYDLELQPARFMDGISVLEQKHFYYLNAERIGPRISYEFETQDFPHTGYQGEYAVQLLHNYQDFNVIEAKKTDNEKSLTLRWQTRAWMDFIIPGISIDNTQLYGKIKKGEVTFGNSIPTNVGFGISYILPIVVAGLIAEKGSMLIVENPEAHLHPLGQSRIGRFLAKIANAGVCVVVETHSEHVINGIRLATLENKISPKDVQINFLTQETSQSTPIVKSIQVNDTGDLTSYPKGFFDQEKKDFAEMIRLKRQNSNK